MEADRRIIITPGISEKLMHETWDAAISYATDHPGARVLLLFHPGEYPLPERGVIVFKDNPTVLRSSPPGVGVVFTYDVISERIDVKHGPLTLMS